MIINLVITTCLLLIFTDFSLQASLPSTRSNATARQDSGTSCEFGTTCTIVTNCTIKNLPETIYPCDSDGYGTISICCPHTTSPTPSRNTFQVPSIWRNLPVKLQIKAKLLPESCGATPSVDRIINGKTAELGQFPWMVLLGYNVNGTIQFNCGGSLISNRYVLTAAHCANVSSFVPVIARLGEWDVSSTLDCMTVLGNEKDCALPVKDARISEITVHEKFGNPNLPSFQNDIALLRLESEVKFNDFIWPICLTPNTFTNYTYKYTVSGWGISDLNYNYRNPILQYATISLYDFNECNAEAPPQNRPLASSQFCAGGNAENSCNGDSGGPLIYSVDNIFYQKGIVSLSTKQDCGAEGSPNIYTEVTSFINWILKHLK